MHVLKILTNKQSRMKLQNDMIINMIVDEGKDSSQPNTISFPHKSWACIAV